ncbi:hypothetical protein J2X12_002901 [Pseudarthrobacter oxydans]|uniref:Uncharacterized protein n=1 Tax=Pseudarthrobacter oxydans TaxID=1671 RepID=A0AAW8NB70_PSEOX|nr:hypothetical protein [Pseudarthrobacter oxydans]MDR6794362.1 hypothetical protein [Pseudarthrobacter oxydans]MDR7164863.1 hypothetical protein [Pseudarthrobacter oxydans]
MANYPFDMQLAVDPYNTSNVVANGQVFIYDPADVNNASPLVLTDPNGLPLTNPLMSNSNGFIPAFIATSPQVKWVGAGFVGYFASFEGLRDVALEAVAKLDGLAVGTVETVDALEGASATVTGTDAKQLNLKIPRGLQGAPGAAGLSNIALDDDGTPYFVAGSNAVQILADTDGAPYFV